MVEEVQGSFDKYKDCELDGKGYFLIKIYSDEDKIGIRFCEMETNKPVIDIFGKIPQELYTEAIKRDLISSLEHAAYLGKELMKAYVCLKLKREYIQDEDNFL